MPDHALLSDTSRQAAGLIAGPLLFLFVVFSGAGALPWEARVVAGGTLWIIAWWISEPVPIAVTSLLPIVLFPASGAMETGAVTAEYGNQIVFLFIGGFLIAIAMEKWKLHIRIALCIVAFIGTSPRRIVGGFLAATAFLSAWISNSATALMMLPVAIAATSRFSGGGDDENFRPALLLAVAYGASIGGIATLVGSPPNMILAGMYQTLTGSEITFIGWAIIAVPVSCSLLVLSWLYLVFVAFPQKGHGEPVSIDTEVRMLGPFSSQERRVLSIFLLTAALWITRSLWDEYLPMVSDANIAVFGAVLLFLIPSGSGGRLLVWEDAIRLPWNIVLLFGCGFAIAKSFVDTGLEAWIAHQLQVLSGVDPILMLLAVIVLILFMTEVTSNTATATIFIPVTAALAMISGINPLFLMVAAAFSSSLGFMLPVGTPPNAIVYSSGHVTMAQMARAGFWMNCISIVILLICIPLLVTP